MVPGDERPRTLLERVGAVLAEERVRFDKLIKS